MRIIVSAIEDGALREIRRAPAPSYNGPDVVLKMENVGNTAVIHGWVSNIAWNDVRMVIIIMDAVLTKITVFPQSGQSASSGDLPPIGVLTCPLQLTVANQTGLPSMYLGQTPQNVECLMNRSIGVQWPKTTLIEVAILH